jgi:hypothetical protein
MADAEPLLVEIPVDSMQAGTDADGLPTTVPGDAAKGADVLATPKEAPKEAAIAVEPVKETRITQEELDQLRAERDAERAARTKIEAEALNLLKAERNKVIESQRSAGENQQIAMRAHWRTVNAEHEQIQGTIIAHKSEMDTAKRELKAAYEAGDFDKVGDLNERIGTLAANLTTLEQGRVSAEAEIARTREAFAAAAKEPAKQEKPIQTPAAKPEPPKQTPEQWISQFPRKTTQPWLKEHMDYVTDPTKHKALMDFATTYRADYGDGMLHTPQFIEALNERFGEPVAREEPETVQAAPAPAPEARKSGGAAATRSAAPVSRNNNVFSSTNLDGRLIKLHPFLAKEARDMGIDPNRYAINSQKLIAEGKLPKNFLDLDYKHDV